MHGKERLLRNQAISPPLPELTTDHEQKESKDIRRSWSFAITNARIQLVFENMIDRDDPSDFEAFITDLEEGKQKRTYESLLREYKKNIQAAQRADQQLINNINEYVDDIQVKRGQIEEVESTIDQLKTTAEQIITQIQEVFGDPDIDTYYLAQDIYQYTAEDYPEYYYLGTEQQRDVDPYPDLSAEQKKQLGTLIRRYVDIHHRQIPDAQKTSDQIFDFIHERKKNLSPEEVGKALFIACTGNSPQGKIELIREGVTFILTADSKEDLSELLENGGKVDYHGAHIHQKNFKFLNGQTVELPSFIILNAEENTPERVHSTRLHEAQHAINRKLDTSLIISGRPKPRTRDELYAHIRQGFTTYSPEIIHSQLLRAYLEKYTPKESDTYKEIAIILQKISTALAPIKDVFTSENRAVLLVNYLQGVPLEDMPTRIQHLCESEIIKGFREIEQAHKSYQKIRNNTKALVYPGSSRIDEMLNRHAQFSRKKETLLDEYLFNPDQTVVEQAETFNLWAQQLSKTSTVDIGNNLEEKEEVLMLLHRLESEAAQGTLASVWEELIEQKRTHLSKPEIEQLFGKEYSSSAIDVIILGVNEKEKSIHFDIQKKDPNNTTKHIRLHYKYSK